MLRFLCIGFAIKGEQLKALLSEMGRGGRVLPSKTRFYQIFLAKPAPTSPYKILFFF